MRALLQLYRRLDLIQRTRWFRIAASVVVVALCAGLFGPLIARSQDLQAQRVALGRALEGQSLADGDPHALSLAETGTVLVDGRTYGGESLKRHVRRYFDRDGELVAVGQLVRVLLADQRPQWVPDFLLENPDTTALLALLAAGWLLLIVWMQITLPFLLTALATAVPVGIAALAGSEQAVVALSGMGLLTFTFVLLTRVVLILFRFPHQTLAVAHTVVKEATRSRISLVFVILLLVGLPLLPIWLDPDTPLRFRIQTFISRSLSLTYALTACMTIFLSCATVAFEIRDRQIWQLVTKPLGRMNYLFGKWLGILSVDVVILVVAGVSIFTYIKYLSQLPVAPGLEGQLDRLAVRDEVLTARSGARPVLERLGPEVLRQRVQQTIERDPELAGREEVSLAARRRLARQIQQEYIRSQRSVPPVSEQAPGANERTYEFRGLREARGLQSSLTLRYRFHMLRDSEHERYPVAFVFDEDPATTVRRQYIPTVTHVLHVGTDLIRDDGTLLVTVRNLFRPPPDMEGLGALNFEPDDFEVLYKAGSFEANFVRAVLTVLLKLGFLAVLGIACSTLLSFPVACLFSFTIFLAGTTGPFLAIALEDYYPPAASQMDWTDVGLVIQWLFQSSIRTTAQGLVFLLRSFGDYRPTQSLVEGRLISWESVAAGFFWLGVIWSGIALLFGWLIIRNRQLAIYSGHG